MKDDIALESKRAALALITAWIATTPSRWVRVGLARLRVTPMCTRTDRTITLIWHENSLAPRRDHITDVYMIIEVVSEHIVGSIMLMVASTLGTRRNVALKKLITAAFVSIKCPTAVVVGLNVRTVVVENFGAWLVSESVDTSHLQAISTECRCQTMSIQS